VTRHASRVRAENCMEEAAAELAVALGTAATGNLNPIGLRSREGAELDADGTLVRPDYLLAPNERVYLPQATAVMGAIHRALEHEFDARRGEA
jgi:hypothetical protein